MPLNPNQSVNFPCKSAQHLRNAIRDVQRFQKTYEALEVEGVQEKKQLTELHQQRVQSELNEKTRTALDNYMNAIDENSDVSASAVSVAFALLVWSENSLNELSWWGIIIYKHCVLNCRILNQIEVAPDKY